MVSYIPCGGDRMTAALMSTYESVHITTKSRGYLRRLCDFFHRFPLPLEQLMKILKIPKG